MKAIVRTKYGSPDVLSLADVTTPEPDDDEVRIAVHAASVNPLDWRLLKADPFFLRLMEGLVNPKTRILGVDVAGRIDAVGKNVTRLAVGDAVFGSIPRGGFAEYACANENLLAAKPANVSFEEAAAAPVVAYSALQTLRDKARVGPGQSVLIHGASGGVGTFAVQLAKYFGTEVTGVCSTRNVELVHSLGADHVIDYTIEDFARSAQRYDVILGIAGDRSLFDYRRALKPNGTLIWIGGSANSQFFMVAIVGSLLSKLGKQRLMPMMAQPSRKDLASVAELLGAGDLEAVIDRRYSLADVPEALRYVEQGHARGKVVIVVKD